MTPSAIVRAAADAGLDMVGICDHNSARNVRAVRRAADGSGIHVIGGMEITSSEEVHVVGLFESTDDDRALEQMQRIVYAHLPGKNDERAFGDQLVCDEDGSIVDRDDHLLIGATTLSIEQVVATIHELGGVAIASHVDREGFGLIGRLGFVPDGLPLDALELSPRAHAAPARWEQLWVKSEIALISSSDAHVPSDVGRSSTAFNIASASVAEIRKALSGIDGRNVAA